jgi:hypothetical protein
MHEAGTPEPHRDGEQAGEGDGAPAHSAHPAEADVDETQAQNDPKHSADLAFHYFEELVHDVSSLGDAPSARQQEA